MGVETFGRPSAFGRPSTWARPTTREEIAREYRLQTAKNIPLPWDSRRLTWAPGRLLETLPSAVQTGAGVSGPTRTILAQILRERPLLRLLRGQKSYHAHGRPSDPNVVGLDPGWELERRRFVGRDYGPDIVSLDEFSIERPKRTLREIIGA